MTIRTGMLALIASAAAGAASAQDYGAMIAQQQMLMQQQAQQMQSMERGIVQQNMQNPAVRQSYQRHLAQGGRMSFEQYAYYYGATGGDTPQGRAAFANNERSNQQREYQAWQGYQGAVQGRGQAQVEQNRRFYENQQEAGRVMQGSQTYADAGSGRNVVLPYLQAGQMYRDPQSGNVYGMDGNGRYWASAPNGSWYPIAPR